MRHLLLAACVGLAACSAWTSSSNTDNQNRRGDATQGVCIEHPEYVECGTAGCSGTAECDTGQFCAEALAQCVAECVPGNDDPCGAGAMCTPHGRCALTGPDPDNDICAAGVAQATFTIPTVVLLVDQSGSMPDPYPGGTRWTVLRDALVDPTNGVVARLQSSVRFGLTLYTSDGGNAGGTCPQLTNVPPALDNYDAINVVYQANSPEGDTPTGESIDTVVDQLIQYSEPGPKYIVLATDGEPDTCAVPNPQTGQPEAIVAAQRSTANGIDLYILSVGEGDVSLGHLQDVANAGIGLPVADPCNTSADCSGGADCVADRCEVAANAPFYEANDQAQLAAAFDAIIGRVLSCTLTVEGTIPSGSPASGTVYLDGDPLAFNDPDGWEYANATTIRLVGAACDLVKAGGEHIVTVEIPCYEPPA